METKIKFNTEEGQANIITDVVKGKLNSVILISQDKIASAIFSELGYEIFNKSEHLGTKYYAPRAVLQGTRSHLTVDDQFDKFHLNERLEVIVSGPKNSEVTLILRIDDE